MLEVVQKRIFDILESDSRITSSGPALPPLDGIPGHPAFLGVRRPESTNPLIIVPAAGYVNLFEHPWDRKPGTYRPAIYAGAFKREPTDRSELPLCINNEGATFKVVIMPLSVVAHGTTHKEARQARNQIVANLSHVLGDKKYRLQSGAWYDMLVNLNESESWTTASGGQSDGIVTSTTVLPVHARYKFVPGDMTDA